MTVYLDQAVYFQEEHFFSLGREYDFHRLICLARSEIPGSLLRKNAQEAYFHLQFIYFLSNTSHLKRHGFV